MKKLPLGNWKPISGSRTNPTKVKRLSDGKIFAIGDFVTNGTRMRGKIVEFNSDEDVANHKTNSPAELYVTTDWSGIGMNLDSISHTDPEKVVYMTPSQFQVRDICVVCFGKERLGAQVTKVTFAEGRVLYDLDIAVSLGMVTRIHGVDSAFVHPINEPPGQMRWAEKGEFTTSANSVIPKEKYVRKKKK